MTLASCESASLPVQSPALATSETNRPIVAFGDSYTEGTGVERAQAYPALLETSLGKTVINAGRLGQTALEALPRMDRDVVAHAPSLVIVEFGVNEAFRGYPVSTAIEGLDKILDKLHQNRIPAILVGVHYAKYQSNFDTELKKLAEKYQCPLVLDVLKGVLDHPDLMSDAYHPNARGYAIMHDRIKLAVEISGATPVKPLMPNREPK